MYVQFTMSDNTIKRALSSWAFQDLNTRKLTPMIIISGARQVGKTFLVRELPASYFNFDTVEVRKAWAKDPYFFRGDSPLVIFDEIHKRKDWKKILKGYYDSPDRNENFIVTGSGKLSQFQRGGDSLQGRYNSYQLWPLTYDEILKGFENTIVFTPARPRDWESWEPDSKAYSDDDLIKLGGFPHPFLSGNERTLRRWQDQYLDRLIREDIREFSAVQRLDQIELLARILPERVASPVSTLSLSEDIESSTVGVKSWLRLFTSLYFGFLLRPYHRKIYRAVKKEPKWYFQQWTFVQKESARFENYIAVQLAAACSAWSEQGHGRWELYYLRDQDKREIDFLIAQDMKPKALIECKLSQTSWPSSLDYYCQKLNVPGFLVYQKGEVRRMPKRGWCLPSDKFLKGLILE